MSSIKIIKNYINGEWVEAKSAELLDVENPGRGGEKSNTFLYESTS